MKTHSTPCTRSSLSVSTPTRLSMEVVKVPRSIPVWIVAKVQAGIDRGNFATPPPFFGRSSRQESTVEPSRYWNVFCTHPYFWNKGYQNETR